MTDAVAVPGVEVGELSRDADGHWVVPGLITLGDGSVVEHDCLLDEAVVVGKTTAEMQAMGAAVIQEAAARYAQGE